MILTISYGSYMNIIKVSCCPSFYQQSYAPYYVTVYHRSQMLLAVDFDHDTSFV